MTEDEAKEKVCPVIRLPPIASAPVAHCLGSGCMAWRSRVERTTLRGNNFPAGDGWEMVGEVFPSTPGMMPDLQTWMRVVGWCGLAGPD